MNYSAAKNDHTDDDAILDAGLVAEARATMRDKFPRIVAFFLEDSETYIRQIEEGFQAGNAETIVPPAHTLKSSAHQMGARKLANLAKMIEAQAKETLKGTQNLSALKPHIESIRQVFNQTKDAFSGQNFSGGA